MLPPRSGNFWRLFLQSKSSCCASVFILRSSTINFDAKHVPHDFEDSFFLLDSAEVTRYVNRTLRVTTYRWLVFEKEADVRFASFEVLRFSKKSRKASGVISFACLRRYKLQLGWLAARQEEEGKQNIQWVPRVRRGTHLCTARENRFLTVGEICAEVGKVGAGCSEEKIEM